MKIIIHLFAFLLLFCVACEEQPLSYNLSLSEASPIKAEEWKKDEANSFYTDLYVTNKYYVFTEYEKDTTLWVFDKNNPQRCLGFEAGQMREKQYYSIDFPKSNTRYKSDKDDIWIVENKNKLRQLQLQKDTLVTVNTDFLPSGLQQSTSFNLGKEELYAVPTEGSLSNTFYFFQPDSGYYWVGMHGVTDKLRYKDNPYAHLSNLVVNENKKAIVCAYLFFNKIQFFDLRGHIIRSVSIGETEIEPTNTLKGSLDYEKTNKCFIDIYGTDRYVYCLFDGSANFDKKSLIFVFNWKGDHISTYQADRILKRIAFDESNMNLVALAVNDKNSRDVVCYTIK